MEDCTKSKRKRKAIDYKKLAEGPNIKLPKQQTTVEKWSTSKLYLLEVLDALEDEQGIVTVLVHYTGWSSKYDEWRPASDIIDIPPEFIFTTEEATNFFYSQLKVLIKETLHIQRKTDSSVVIRMPIQKDSFNKLQSFGSRSSTKTQQYSAKCQDLDVLFGKGWHYRIVNANRDFAYVIDGTITFRLVERIPLVEQSPDGKNICTHRGYMIVFNFVRGRGNASDLEKYLTLL